MKFLDRIYFDNTLRSYLIVFITILFAFILKRIISRYAASLLFRMVKKKDRLNRIKFINLIITPFERLLFVLISFFSIDRLNFPQALVFKIHTVSSHEIVNGIASAIIIICFISLVIRFLDFLVLLIKEKAGSSNTPGEHQLLFFFKDLLRVVIIILGFAIILKFSFGLDISNLLTGLSIVGAALALAAKESLENLIASFIIFFDKPFQTGDLVKVNNYSGTVERIGLRSTRLRTAEKSTVTVPNKQMVDSILDNWSTRDSIRNEMKTLLPAQSSSDDIEKTITGIKEILAAKKDTILNYSVYLQEINTDSAVIMIIYFTRYPMALDDLNALREEINIEVRKLHEKNDIRPATSTTVKLVS
ncbi:MAG TPA: mechanosensitive ion channel family protein [Chitinophagaceae bacterium]|nr:mechanosensitive ion channel family protein [Chitinophagaceae bacterium]